MIRTQGSSAITWPSLALVSMLALGFPASGAAQLCPHTPEPLALPSQPSDAPEQLWALVEIPALSSVKYELHPGTGRMEVDRFLSMPMVYPANYGILPCTLADDGDALDVLVLTREPVAPGTLIQVRVVGILRMVDRGENDHKIVAVPTHEVDPSYAGLQDLEDLPQMDQDVVAEFFRVYKRLPDPGVNVQVGPWEDREAALQEVRAALRNLR